MKSILIKIGILAVLGLTIFFMGQRILDLNIALDNTQVEYILIDEDVYNFYKKICDGENCTEAEEVLKIMEKK